MSIRLYVDDTIDIRLDEIVENLNRLAPSLGFIAGKSRFAIGDSIVVASRSYKQLGERLCRESKNDRAVMLFTGKPYDNNYFWESDGNKRIVSLSGWEYLTSLPRDNGVVYFVCAILLRSGSSCGRHQKNTGCIFDFWQDKTGVDAGMRCAYVCQKCLQELRKTYTGGNKNDLTEIQVILNDVSISSRENRDICDLWGLQKGNGRFDVFMCHNSEDKDIVRAMNARLKTHGINTWLDEEQLPPGRAWQEILEEQIDQIKTAAIFVGSSGIGPWQRVEIRAFIAEFVQRRCPVIPVILPDCAKVPELPIFLRQLAWVDFRKKTPAPFEHLLWGITGKRL